MLQATPQCSAHRLPTVVRPLAPKNISSPMATLYFTSPALTTSGQLRTRNGMRSPHVNVRSLANILKFHSLILSFIPAICSPTCQNNGICVAPGQCTCPENFLGPQCQHQKKLCLQKPDLPSNSRISCTPSQCTVTCAKGYRFPDGSTVTNMVCKNGDWTPSKADWNTVPNCQRKDLCYNFPDLLD